MIVPIVDKQHKKYENNTYFIVLTVFVTFFIGALLIFNFEQLAVHKSKFLELEYPYTWNILQTGDYVLLTSPNKKSDLVVSSNDIDSLNEFSDDVSLEIVKNPQELLEYLDSGFSDGSMCQNITPLFNEDVLNSNMYKINSKINFTSLLFKGRSSCKVNWNFQVSPSNNIKIDFETIHYYFKLSEKDVVRIIISSNGKNNDYLKRAISIVDSIKFNE